MSILFRYVFRQAAGALVLILSSLSGVVWIALALRQLNLVTTQGQDAATFLAMTTLALPNLVALIAPIALLIACIHTLNRLAGDSELIVMTAGGAGLWRVARPLLALALVVALGVSLVNHVLQPWSMRKLRDMIIDVRTDLISQVLQPGRFSSPEPGLTFHIRDRAITGELEGLMLHDSRDAKQVTTYLAERGAILREGLSAYLVMQRGQIQRRELPAEPVQIVTFETYAVDLNQFERKGEAVELRPRERYFHELVAPMPDDKDFLRQPGHFRAELHERFANPLYPFAFVLIVVAALGIARSTRQGRVQMVVAAFTLAAAVRLAGLAVNNLVVLKAAATPLLYILPLAAATLALLWAMAFATPRRGPTPGDRIAMAAGGLTRLLSRRAPAGRAPPHVRARARGA